MSHVDGETAAQSQAPIGLAPGAPNSTNTPVTMSRSPTVTSERTAAAAPGDALGKTSPKVEGEYELPSESTLGKVEKQLEAEGKAPHEHHLNALASLPPGRKSILLFCFCRSMVRRARAKAG